MKSLMKFIPYTLIVAVTLLLVFLVDSDKPIENVASEPVKQTVIIDAGHGGMDGGAVAADGTQEQYLNLDIALKMNEYLKSRGYNTILTRSDNNSIHDADSDTIRQQKVSDIHNRLKIIESNPDSVFVSIHQNYFTESQYSGTQVFYSVNNAASEYLAACIQSSVVSLLQPDNKRQIKQSGSSIYLLHHSKVPSVMVECGFLSNVQETEKLKCEDYRRQMAEAVCKGIIDYFNVRHENVSAVIE